MQGHPYGGEMASGQLWRGLRITFVQWGHWQTLNRWRNGHFSSASESLGAKGLGCKIGCSHGNSLKAGRKLREESEVFAFLNTVRIQGRWKLVCSYWSRCRQLSQGVTLTMKGLEEEKMGPCMDKLRCQQIFTSGWKSQTVVSGQPSNNQGVTFWAAYGYLYVSAYIGFPSAGHAGDGGSDNRWKKDRRGRL